MFLLNKRVTRWAGRLLNIGRFWKCSMGRVFARREGLLNKERFWRCFYGGRRLLNKERFWKCSLGRVLNWKRGVAK